MTGDRISAHFLIRTVGIGSVTLVLLKERFKKRLMVSSVTKLKVSNDTLSDGITKDADSFLHFTKLM